MGQAKAQTRTEINGKYLTLLVVLAAGLLLLAFRFHGGRSATDNLERKSVSHAPDITKSDLSEGELRSIVDGLMRTHRWFNSLPFGHLEYSVIVTKSDVRYERDIENEKSGFPDARVDETTVPTLARQWSISKTVSFDAARVACISRSNALGTQIEVWDGNVLTGYVDYGTAQEPNYYLKSDVGGSLPKLAWFPQVGPPAIWFYSGGDEWNWQREPPILVGATHFAGRNCVVLRDAQHHWIVGREDHRLYGRYTKHEWEQFDQHREVSEGIFWPMASLRMRYGIEGLEWTDRTTITALRVDQAPDDSVFQVTMKAGVKVCDLRNEYPVVFTSDPSRTEEELAEIYATARQSHARSVSADQESLALVGEHAPELGEGRWLNSQPLSIDEFRGRRSVLLGFGHTACAPCGNMLALFSRLQEASDDQLILVFAASDSVSDVEKKSELYGLHCPVFIPSDESGFGEVFERYRIHSYPTIVAIDVSGAITSHQNGTLSVNATAFSHD